VRQQRAALEAGDPVAAEIFRRATQSMLDAHLGIAR
jgi:hypothetical protein